MEALLARMKRSGLLGQMVTAADLPEVVIADKPVIDFAITNYLGLNRHPQIIEALVAAAYQWGISLGAPRRYAETCLQRRLEWALAQLAGQESALVFPSTSQLALDVIPILAGPRGVIQIDSQAYPLSWQGARQAASGGARLCSFVHNNPEDLESNLRKNRAAANQLIVVDGIYAAGGELASLESLYDLASAWNAWLYVDDAHGFGVLGAGAKPSQPLGYGGAGSPAHWGLSSGRILHIASLSKAFGVPISFISGPRDLIDHIRSRAGSLEHSSPVAIPLIAAAIAALDVHQREGEARRESLLSASHCLHNILIRTLLPVAENLFPPIQSLLFNNPRQAFVLASRLRQNGIWAVLQFQPPDRPQGAALRFLVGAGYGPNHMARLDRVLQKYAQAKRSGKRKLAFPKN